MTGPDFNTWVKAKGYAPNGKWVVARKTARTAERYPDSTFFNPKRYIELVEEHRLAVRALIVEEIVRKHHLKMHPTSARTTDALIEAFEAGRRV